MRRPLMCALATAALAGCGAGPEPGDAAAPAPSVLRAPTDEVDATTSVGDDDGATDVGEPRSVGPDPNVPLHRTEVPSGPLSEDADDHLTTTAEQVPTHVQAELDRLDALCADVLAELDAIDGWADGPDATIEDHTAAWIETRDLNATIVDELRRAAATEPWFDLPADLGAEAIAAMDAVIAATSAGDDGAYGHASEDLLVAIEAASEAAGLAGFEVCFAPRAPTAP